ncbi:MAG: hypothetical protein ABI353_11410 [Isosphaeraceae bacterium]
MGTTMNVFRLKVVARVAWAPALLLGALTGCGNSDAGAPVTTHRVKGKVVLPDGTPLTEGTVTFVPTAEPGRQAASRVEPDGTFTLTTVYPGDGAAEGTYKVRIDTTLTAPGPRRGMTRFLVPPKYQDEDRSGLRITVNAGPNDLAPFRLDTKPAS